MQSIWSRGTDIKEYPPLSGDLSVDVAVIGGGLAGILTAYFLQKEGKNVVVLEKERIGGGQTKNTTAKITSQHGLIYAGLIKKFGMDKARQYASANEQAIEHYLRIIRQEEIDCELSWLPAYFYSVQNKHKKALKKEAAAARELGIDAEFVQDTELPFEVSGAVRFNGQAQFHPLKFLRGIAKDLKIYENTLVSDVDGGRVVTENGTVVASQVVFATHYPFMDKQGLYFSRIYQERSYVIALSDAQQLNGMYLEIGKDGLSMRNSGNLLLLGGGDHRTGENSKGGAYAYLTSVASRLWPESSEFTHWSAQDCKTLDGIPYIGRFTPGAKDWYVATGFAKWGMTHSMVSAMILSDMIMGKDNCCAEVFSPHRLPPPSSIKELLINLGQSIKGLARRFFARPEKDADALEIGHGGVINYKGKKAGAYRDEHGKVYVVCVKCPHMGCQLEWNADEKSWDCPCHGSRFDYTGKLIDSPAQVDLERLK